MKTNQCPNLQAWSILSSPWNMEGNSFKHPKSPGKIILLSFSDLRNHESFSVWQQDVIWKSGNYLLPQQSTQKAGSWCTLQSTGSQISSAREETAQDTSDGSCCYSWGRKDSLKSSHMIKKKICCCCDSQFGKAPVGVAQYVHRDTGKNPNFRDRWKPGTALLYAMETQLKPVISPGLYLWQTRKKPGAAVVSTELCLHCWYSVFTR